MTDYSGEFGPADATAGHLLDYQNSSFDGQPGDVAVRSLQG